MIITQAEKDRLFANIIRLQREDGFYVGLYRAGRDTGLSDSKVTAILKALAIEGSIRLGGERGNRWCVANVADKRQQILDSIGPFGRPFSDLETILAVTGLHISQAVDLCIMLYREGRFKIIGLEIEQHEPPEPDDEGQDKDEDRGQENA